MIKDKLEDIKKEVQSLIDYFDFEIIELFNDGVSKQLGTAEYIKEIINDILEELK